MNDTMNYLKMIQVQMNANRMVALSILGVAVLATGIFLNGVSGAVTVQGGPTFIVGDRMATLAMCVTIFLLWLAHASAMDRYNRYRGLLEATVNSTHPITKFSMDVGSLNAGNIKTLWSTPDAWVFVGIITCLGLMLLH